MSDEPSQPPSYVVFGASGGIGSALSRRLALSGAHVLACTRDPGKVETPAGGGEVIPFEADGAQWEEIGRAVDACRERHGRIDGVAHCVGSLLLRSAHTTSREQWDEVIRVNLTSAFGVVQASARAMQKTGGSIVLVASSAARQGLPSHEGIAAAKAGIIGLTLSAAASYAPKKIRVNAVAPGLTETPMTAGITGNEAARKASLAMHPLGRLGKPDDIASAIAWFLDPSNDWVTGQVLGVDGGLADLSIRR